MKFTNEQLMQMSNAARSGAVRAMRAANSGHLGIALDAADIMTAIYTSIYAIHLNPGQDKFVLSAGHGSALLYSVLKLRGYDLPGLETFRKLGGLPGHPEYGIPGVETTTGPLGQGVANAVGMALGAKMWEARGRATSRVYCLCSDGDLMEGVAQEAVAFAGIYRLNNLILLWDDNGISIDGKALTDLDLPMRMRAAGWAVFKVNGHRFSEINAALDKAKKSAVPAFIQCVTTIGLGSDIAGEALAHGLALKDDQLAALERKFESEEGKRLWVNLAVNYPPAVAAPRPQLNGTAAAMPSVMEQISTRELSGKYLEELLPREPLLIGGSADLAESTNTRVASSRDITPDDFSGNYIHFGVREHSMAAIMNGLTLQGFRTYGGTFLIFSDYMRAAQRLSALMELPVVYVLTHDSIALGEDGPTHQPVEQLAGLRLMPNMNVFRPCNGKEVKWAWDTALAEASHPTCIVLSRQKFEQVETPAGSEINRGAYIIHSPVTGRQSPITLIATGSEVPLAVAVAEKIGASVVSMPSVEKFRLQDAEYKHRILRGRVIAIEAGATAGWYEFADAVVGIDWFGASGDGASVYKHFGFDAYAIAEDIMKYIK
ncbi:MAG: transketolase [Alphaproteobacteria bacterium]|nr:transketolase [Alphaproteobacteria bacterium]